MHSLRKPILVADDDDATLEGLTELLGEFGYQVVAARDGQVAMDLIVGGLKPALFIVDLAMPNLAGGEFLKYVQSDPELRFVPVLVITGSPELIGRTVADAIVPKPVNLIELLAHVRRLTSRKHSARASSEVSPQQ